MLVTVLFGSILIGDAYAQSSPQELASAVSQQWSTGSKSEFENLFPFAEGRRLFSESSQRLPGLASVIRSNSQEAVILLSGVPSLPNSGDATVEGFSYSGVYLARSHGAAWKLAASIPLEQLGTLAAHQIKVNIRPGDGLSVEDRMQVAVKGANGFAVRLNHSAKIESVRSGGRDLHYLFGGGLLWVDLPSSAGDFTIRYSLAVPAGPENTNSGCFLKSSGHVRNQFIWSPSFDLDSPAAGAAFDVEVRIPAEYQVSTSLTQTEQVEGGERVVWARTQQPTYALSLIYDRDWSIQRRRCGNAALEIRMLPGTEPGPAAVGDEFCTMYGLLSRRFGAPAGDHFGAVQARSWQDNPGWRFTSNTIVVAVAVPGPLSRQNPVPGAPLGHEVAHLWTQRVSGPAATFLSEGWAAWAESLILEKEFGAETMRNYWRWLSLTYFAACDGKASLTGDRRNGGVAYIKGPWVYRMLEDALGREGFDRAMTEFWAARQPQNWEDLARVAQRYSPPEFDARRFLQPWLEGNRAPRLTVEQEGREVVIHSDAPEFLIPVIVQVSTSAGPVRHRFWISGAATRLELASDVQDVKLDPDELLLIRH